MNELEYVADNMGFRKSTFAKTNNALENIKLAIEEYKQTLKDDIENVADECNATELELLFKAGNKLLKRIEV